MLTWFSAHARDLPWRHTRDPYAIWVSEIMLQQTQVKTVLPYWERWMRALPTIQAAAKASPAKLHKLWEGLGYYTRVRNLQKAAQQIVSGHDGKFPKSFEDILALPGIGRYTAGAIASIAFNQPHPILDGNVIRVLTRVFGIRENPREKKTNAKLWQIADVLVKAAASDPPLLPQGGEGRGEEANCNAAKNRVIGVKGNIRKTQSPHPNPLPVGRGEGDTSVRLPDLRSSRRKEAHSDFGGNGQSLLTSAATGDNSCSHLNQSLMELGALICLPRSPRCALCPVSKLCVARKLNLHEELPNLDKRAQTTARRFIAFVIKHDGKFLVRQRPDGIVNGHLWEFPNVEVGARHSGPQRAQKEFGLNGLKTSSLCTIKHTITRYRITLEAYRGEVPGRRPTLQGTWLPLTKLHQLAFSSAHKKILTQLKAK